MLQADGTALTPRPTRAGILHPHGSCRELCLSMFALLLSACLSGQIVEDSGMSSSFFWASNARCPGSTPIG